MLYFLAAGDLIKIGWSSTPFDRTASFQVGNHEECRLLLVLAIDNSKHIESVLHERLDYCRKRGEWFDVTFQQAFEHLCDIRKQLHFTGQKQLMLASDPKPLLEDHHEAFRKWVMATYEITDWNEELYPLSYFWDMARDEFIAQKNK